MLSWFVQLPDQKLKRVTEENVKLYRERLIFNQDTPIALNSNVNLGDYLYGDILFMIQKDDQLTPIELPKDPAINLLEHPQIQEFISNTRNKLKMQIKKYEEILDSLKKSNFEEENFEKEFFDELNKLRSHLYKNSSEILQEKLNLTQKRIENLVKSNGENMAENNKIEGFLQQTETSSKNKQFLKKEEISPKVKTLFSN